MLIYYAGASSRLLCRWAIFTHYRRIQCSPCTRNLYFCACYRDTEFVELAKTNIMALEIRATPTLDGSRTGLDVPDLSDIVQVLQV